MTRNALPLVALLLHIILSVDAAPLSTAVNNLLTDLDANAILSNCKSIPGGCRSQSTKSRKNRDAVKESMTKNYGPGHAPGMSSDKAEELLQGLQSFKAALYEVYKLTGIVPHDNGLLGGDRCIKDKRELDTMIGRLKRTLPPLDVDLSAPGKSVVPLVGGVLGRKKRSDGVALDYYRGNRWPSNTINVFIDPNIWSASEISTIRKCLKAISANVPCLTFVESTTEPKIDYVKVPKGTDAGTCGWSSVGYQKGQRNDVNLNFASSICSAAIEGVVIHETLHSLGLAHEHTRNDRDDSMKIEWPNVDPQAVSDFDKDDPNDYSPIGQPYDELSIMHYDVYVGSVSSSKRTMTPRKRPDLMSKIGNGNSMADKDAKWLKRHYCSSPNCRDSGSNCGWKALTDCSSIKSVCPKSCGTCDGTSG